MFVVTALQLLPYFCFNFPNVYLPCLDSKFSDLGLVGKIVKSRMYFWVV